MQPPTPWTIGRLLEWTTKYLGDRGAEQPRLDAEVLLAHVRGTSRIELYTAFHDLADESTRSAFRELVRRRADGCPVAYLVGRREFFSLSFRVNPDVLIPRPETEFTVMELLELAKPTPRPQIADVGTGSGAIAICAAKHICDARIYAIDVSQPALAVAKQNANDHGVQHQIDFVCSDLFADVPHTRRFDIVVSNPPYIGLCERDSLSPDVRDHEPHLALFGGDQGWETVERLIRQSADRLNDRGWLIIEIGPHILSRTIDLLTEHGGFGPPAVVRDLAQLPRVVKARRNT